MLNSIELLKNIADSTIENYLGMSPIIDRPRSKCRLYRSTKPKIDKEKQKIKKKIAKQSKKINRRK